MKKISVMGMLMGAAIVCAAPISLHQLQDGGLSLSLDSAQARLGRPLTPVSVAGVHRRAVRRCAAGVTCQHYKGSASLDDLSKNRLQNSVALLRSGLWSGASKSPNLLAKRATSGSGTNASYPSPSTSVRSFLFSEETR